MKRRSSGGESLVESLVSILILTFGSILLLTLVSAAGKINRSAKEADRAYFRQLMETELTRQGQGTGGEVTVTVNGNSQTLVVEIFGEDLTAWYVEDSQ